MDWFRDHLTEPSVPFYVFAMPRSEAEFLTVQREYLRKHKFSTEPKLTIFDYSDRTFDNRKINIGFLSANWRNHPEAFIIGELIENIDRSKFNLFLYDIEPFQNDFKYKQRIINAAGENYFVVNHLSDFEIANKIHDDKIDVLYDFNAFTFFNRINIMTFQPAPIQASYLGYPETVGGLQGIDYVIADSYVIPPDHKQYYPEHVMYLDPCAYTYDNKCIYPESKFTRKAFGLPEDAFVLACFCNDYKITPDYFDIWMRVMNKLPNTVLWLYSTSPSFEENIKNEAEKRGVSADRIYFTYRQSHPEYMAKLRVADLFLDTQYCNAHTTAIETLFMNLPIITCPGNTWPSRVAGSVLTTMEMPELIAKDPREYEEKIIFYASHPDEFKKLKEKLAEKKKTSPFFDSALYARHFEQTCLDMIEIYEKEHPTIKRGKSVIPTSNPKVFYYGGYFNFGDQLNVDLLKYLNHPMSNTSYEWADVICIGSLLGYYLGNKKTNYRPLHVFGSGFIAPPRTEKERFCRDMRFHAIRGKLSKNRCELMTGQSLANIPLGDPGLLIKDIFSTIKKEKKYDVGIILHEVDKSSPLLDNIKLKNCTIFDTSLPPEEFVKRTSECEFILSSALHGIICADSLGVPNQHIILSDRVGTYKFQDYYSIFDKFAYEPKNLNDTIIDKKELQTFCDSYQDRTKQIEVVCKKLLTVFEDLKYLDK